MILDVPADPARLNLTIASGPPHLRPLLIAVRDHNVALVIVPPAREHFNLPTGQPVVVFVAGDLDRAYGPDGFHRPSIRRALESACAAIIVSSVPDVLPYAAAGTIAIATSAIKGPSTVVLIETGPDNPAATSDRTTARSASRRRRTARTGARSSPCPS